MCLSGVRAIRDLVVVNGVDGRLHGFMLATFPARRTQGDLATLLVEWDLGDNRSAHVMVVLSVIVPVRPREDSPETSDLEIVVGQRESCLSSWLEETEKEGQKYTPSRPGGTKGFRCITATVMWAISLPTEGINVRTQVTGDVRSLRIGILIVRTNT